MGVRPHRPLDCLRWFPNQCLADRVHHARLRDQETNDNGQEQPQRSAIVTPKRKRSTLFGDVPDTTPEEHQRRGDAADALFREIVRRATADERD